MQSKNKTLRLEDSGLYVLWRLANNDRFNSKTLFSSRDFNPPQITSSETALIIIKILKELKVLNPELILNKENYLHKNPEAYNNAMEYIKNNPKTEKAIIFKKILNNNCSLDNFEYICSNKFKVCDHIEFSKKLLNSIKNGLSKKIDLYIKDFIENNLTIKEANYYNFETQKKVFYNNIKSDVDKYGHSFIFEFNPSVGGVHFGRIYKLGEDPAYLFIHILIALEHLGYTNIEKIDVISKDEWYQDKLEAYKIKIDVKDKYFYKKNKIMREESPAKPIEKLGNQKKSLDFDDKKSTLYFNNKEIIISKSRNSNGHYLLKTIFKDKNKIWEFDEIAEDWSDEYNKKDWNRYYNAGYKVNEKIAKETTIKDFLDITNKTVGINKKYM